MPFGIEKAIYPFQIILMLQYEENIHHMKDAVESMPARISLKAFSIHSIMCSLHIDKQIECLLCQAKVLH